MAFESISPMFRPRSNFSYFPQLACFLMSSSNNWHNPTMAYQLFDCLQTASTSTAATMTTSLQKSLHRRRKSRRRRQSCRTRTASAPPCSNLKSLHRRLRPHRAGARKSPGRKPEAASQTKNRCPVLFPPTSIPTTSL